MPKGIPEDRTLVPPPKEEKLLNIREINKKYLCPEEDNCLYILYKPQMKHILSMNLPFQPPSVLLAGYFKSHNIYSQILIKSI